MLLLLLLLLSRFPSLINRLIIKLAPASLGSTFMI
jgi:hypothetical protein